MSLVERSLEPFGRCIVMNGDAKPSPWLKSKTVGVISAAFSGGQKRGGVDRGPQQLVEAGLLTDLEELGWTVDFGKGHDALPSIASPPASDEPIGKLLKPRYVSQVTHELSDAVYSYTSRGQLALTLGGDHSLAMGTVDGTLRAYPDACLIWIDAHADINTPETTDSGSLHGCPVAFLLGLAGCNIPEFAWLKPMLSAKRLAYIGLRDVDPPEKRILRENGIAAYSMHEVDRYGIGKVVEMALEAVNPSLKLPIHLSFDVDALDPTVAPSTGTLVRGGLSWREGHFICEAIAETGQLVALDLMEVNPALGDKVSVAQTVEVGRSLVRCALGETLL